MWFSVGGGAIHGMYRSIDNKMLPHLIVKYVLLTHIVRKSPKHWF